MNPIVKNILAVIAGAIIGGLVNMGLVQLGPMIIPLPEGADISNVEAFKESMHLFKPVNFIAPFLAHAVGTFVGAFIAAKLAASHGMKLALGVGIFFLLGGISAVVMFGGPLWFKVADILLAYLPTSYLGGKLATKAEVPS